MAVDNKTVVQPVPCAPAGAATAIETHVAVSKSVVIGRAPECDLVIQDAKASRRHCRLTRGADSFLLEDLGSKNGTFVDGKRIQAPVSLKVSQTFKVGDTIFYLS